MLGWRRENETKGRLTRPLLLLASVTELLAIDIIEILCDLGRVLYPLWASVFMTRHPVNKGLKDIDSQFLKSTVCHVTQDWYSRVPAGASLSPSEERPLHKWPL